MILRRFLSYYKLFPKSLGPGPPNGKFAINPQELRKEYLQLQQQIHPDIAKETGPIDAATLSTAYKAMLNPLTRAQHILDTRGVKSLDEDANIQDEDMLMTIMMIREEADEAETEEQKEKLDELNNQRIDECVENLEKAFAADDLQAAKKITIALSYWIKLRDTLRNN